MGNILDEVRASLHERGEIAHLDLNFINKSLPNTRRIKGQKHPCQGKKKKKRIAKQD